jgi:wyosine [tRNA(Phe)-imidazoG37] synthetase (radical SAM superfamily)
VKEAYRFLFGPVPSRRFGRSLGVDLIPLKTCSFNCVFCQLGRTTNLTLNRAVYAPLAEVEAEWDRWRAMDGRADYVTLSGSGEPTLHSGFGELLALLKRSASMPVALLSNGSLFHLPEVRAAAAGADVVKVSLSAWDAASFRRINRPHPDLAFADMLAGLRAFRAQYGGRLWLEVFLVPGLNTAEESVDRLAAHAERLEPDEIHLNTAVRPPAEGFVEVLDRAELERLAARFRPRATVIAAHAPIAAAPAAVHEAAMLAMLRRRPCTLGQLASAFGLHVNEAAKFAGEWTRRKLVVVARREGEMYYSAVGRGAGEGT